MRYRNKEEGFTLVELLVTLVVFLFVMVAASNIFSSFVSSFKQQTSIAETNIEGVVGLELLKNDIEQAGFGLPWDLDGVAYNEAVNDGNTVQDDTSYNDAASDSPRAFVHGDNEGMGGSDVLVIKATNVAVSRNAQRYTYVTNDGVSNLPPVVWEDPEDNLEAGSNVIVLKPVVGERHRVLKSNGSFYTQFSAAGLPSAFSPDAEGVTLIIYGINNGAPPVRFPFNRADYYIRVPASNFPARCAPGTGVLYKAAVNHNGGGHSEYPLLDCVADFQVHFRLDTNNDGTVDTDGITAGATAETVRDQVRDVRAYILAHEGQYDPDFTFTNYTGTATCPTCIRVGEPQDNPAAALAMGRDFDLSTLMPDTRFRNYRWKVYTMVLKPFNLR